MTTVTNLAGMLPEDTADLDVLKQGGTESTGWKITFAGPAHEKTVAWSNETSRKNMRKENQIEMARVNGRKYKAEDKDPEEQKRENVMWVVSRIVSWTPVDIGAGPIEFSEEAAVKLLLNPKMAWAFTQMIEFLADDRSFTPRSAQI